MRRNAILNKKTSMLSVSTALSGMNSQARSFYCRSAAEFLADAEPRLKITDLGECASL